MPFSRTFVWIVLFSFMLSGSFFAPARSAGQGQLSEKAFRNVFKMLKAQSPNQQLTDAELYLGAIEGMLKAAAHKDIREYNQVLQGDAYQEIKISSSGKLAGIGAILKVGSSQSVSKGLGSETELIISQAAPLMVMDVFEGSPAQKAGLQPQDVVLAIDKDQTDGMSFRQAIYALRGVPGSKVNVVVLRGSQTKKIPITRGNIVFPTMHKQILNNKIGYLAISAFTQRSANEAVEIFKEFKQNNIRGLVLDLRDNGGGSLEQVIAIAENLLDSDQVIATIMKRKSQVTHQGKQRLFGNIPTVVLVNGRTASGAEMLSRALQENDLALLVGEDTFGKNSVEKVEEISKNVAIKYTIARWVSPRKLNQSQRGIQPDIPVSMDEKLWQSLRFKKNMNERLQKDVQLRVAYQTLLFKID